MRRLNCRPSELTIVVNSFDPANIGSIVNPPVVMLLKQG